MIHTEMQITIQSVQAAQVSTTSFWTWSKKNNGQILLLYYFMNQYNSKISLIGLLTGYTDRQSQIMVTIFIDREAGEIISKTRLYHGHGISSLRVENPVLS